MQISEVNDMVRADPALKTKLETDPVGTLETMAAAMPLQTDVWIYRAIVVGLVAVALVAVCGGAVLAFYEKSLPAEISTIAGGAVGAMAGLLVPGRR